MQQALLPALRISTNVHQDRWAVPASGSCDSDLLLRNSKIQRCFIAAERPSDAAIVAAIGLGRLQRNGAVGSGMCAGDC